MKSPSKTHWVPEPADHPQRGLCLATDISAAQQTNGWPSCVNCRQIIKRVAKEQNNVAV